MRSRQSTTQCWPVANDEYIFLLFRTTEIVVVRNPSAFDIFVGELSEINFQKLAISFKTGRGVAGQGR